MNRTKGSRLLQQMIFVGPSAFFFILILIVPFLLGIYYSFTNWNGVGSSHIDVVGLDNYKQIFFDDPKFKTAFWFTAKFTLLGVILTNLIGFVLGYLLTKPLKTRNVLRTIFFMPNVIGGLLLGFIWQFIFIKGFASIGEATNFKFFSLPWLGTENTAFWGIVIVFIWQTAGYLMIIYISSFNNVPKDILEAAEIDGANRWQLLMNIIIPLVMPAITVCLFLAISWSFKMFDLNLSLTKGGPFGSTESVAMNIYTEAFANNRMGLGSAKAMIFFIVVAVITSVQVKVTKSKEVEA